VFVPILDASKYFLVTVLLMRETEQSLRFYCASLSVNDFKNRLRCDDFNQFL